MAKNQYSRPSLQPAPIASSRPPKNSTRKNLHDLVLRGTAKLLDTVLLLLDLLAGLGNLLLKARTDHTVLGLELLHGVNVVVDQTKPSGLATTKLSAEAEEADARVVRDIVHLGELLAELRLRKKREEEGERRSVTSSPRGILGQSAWRKPENPSEVSVGDGAHLGHVGAAGVENIEDLRGKRVRNVTVSIVLQSWRARLVRRASPGMKSPENTGCTVRKLGAARVAVRESGTHELATAKQTVSHELARAEGARGVRHLGNDPVGCHCA